jgi:adenosylcobinamide-phosphate synthase
MSTLAGAFAVPMAFAADAILGEPPAAWHPVVWMGRALSASGAPWPATSPGNAFWRGMAVWCLGACATMLVTALALAAVVALTRTAPPPWSGIVHAVLMGLLLKPLLAWRMLHDEVAAVEDALAANLDAGRDRLSRLVSRDTAGLSAVEVRESALESLAENLNDSFVAPLFWFVIGGLPGAAVYRFANTADAMWGYHGRWEWAGKWSAHADDLLSFVPARLTALFIAVVSRSWPRNLPREAGRTPSPNGGWPMAMLALALDVQLGKPGSYLLHADGRSAAPADLWRGLRIGRLAACLAVGVAWSACAVLAWRAG